MSALLISRAVRSEVKALLAAQFNDLLAQACDEFDISEQAFDVDYDGGSNCFAGAFRVEDLRQYVGQYGPCQVIYAKGPRDNHDEFPRKFKGPVEVHIDTHLRFACDADSVRPPDVESLCEAVEGATVEILRGDTAFLGSVSAPTQGTLTFDRTEPERQQNFWYVSVLCSMECEVTV